MALFGDTEGDVGPFVMTEDGEEWFPFTLDNLEMDRGCTSLGQDSNPMEQDDGVTDQDDDVDAGCPAGDSGPGPPERGSGGNKGSSNGSNARSRWIGGGSGSGSGGGGGGGGDGKSGGNGGLAAPKQQQRPGAKGVSVPPAKAARLDKVKVEAKEVHSKQELKRLVAESALAKRNSSRGSRGDQKSKHRTPAGGMAGGVGGMTSRSEAAPWSGKDREGGKTTSISAPTKGPNVHNRRRLERNAREQKRSLKISQRIEDLRLMLSQFGVDVKTSKSAVLSEATDYIAHLQRQHAQSEAERARILQLLQNAQREAGADIKPSTAAAAAAAAAATGSAAASGRTAGAAANAGGPASAVPSAAAAAAASAAASSAAAAASAAASSAAAAAAAAPPAPTPTTHPGRTVKPPPSGTQQRTIPLGAATAIEGMGVCGVEPVSESWMVHEGAAAAAASGAGGVAAGVAPQQADVPGFPGLSVAARGAGEGVVPMQMFGGLMPAASVAVAAPAACGGGGGATNLDATARALSHVNYDRVFRTVPVPIAIANVNGNLVDCNARLTQVTGFRKEEVLFMTIFDLVADAFLQHTFSMISSILSLRGVANPPFFQVLGKHRDGTPGGVVQISVVQDEALRPLHFCICVMEGGGAGVAAAAGPGDVGVGVGCGGVGGNGMMMAAGPGGGGVGGNNGGVVRIRANVGGPT